MPRPNQAHYHWHFLIPSALWRCWVCSHTPHHSQGGSLWSDMLVSLIYVLTLPTTKPVSWVQPTYCLSLFGDLTSTLKTEHVMLFPPKFVHPFMFSTSINVSDTHKGPVCLLGTQPRYVPHFLDDRKQPLFSLYDLFWVQMGRFTQLLARSS